jgi:hypothetical protein
MFQCGLKIYNMKKMKKTIYLLIMMVAVLASCTEEYSLENNGLGVEELPGYVAFSAPGVSTSLAPEETSEDGGMVSLNVEIPTTSPTDVTVNYQLGGSAVYGVDYTINGATSAGGSLIIPRSTEINLDGLADNADIDVQLLTDDEVDGVKTIEVTLVSASNTEGNIAVGRAGTDLLKTALINIADIDE